MEIKDQFQIEGQNGHLQEHDFLHKLGSPESSNVQRVDGEALKADVPRYIVQPTTFPMDMESFPHYIKIIDFGQSFLDGKSAEECHTPMRLRAPEIIFGDKVDYRMDLWSMGCMTFELIVGQPPFDDFLPKQSSMLVHQMLQTIDEDLPDGWQGKWQLMDSERRAMKERLQAIHGIPLNDDPACLLQDWLEECYFSGHKKEDMERADIHHIVMLIRKMLRFEPSARASARDLLQDTWLQESEQNSQSLES
ncbi:hypothetical protein E8E12_010582 [Didymella heteroderae]|uniref:Protein kinase domain-containing protein n=1 Tax=Didymella heteroderae TaxID=1769908 RepID=A0A9P4WY68_9PLEO|nr:hypothetical protein E8E12_010582 [Didymella heteroderae]